MRVYEVCSSVFVNKPSLLILPPAVALLNWPRNPPSPSQGLFSRTSLAEVLLDKNALERLSQQAAEDGFTAVGRMKHALVAYGVVKFTLIIILEWSSRTAFENRMRHTCLTSVILSYPLRLCHRGQFGRLPRRTNIIFRLIFTNVPSSLSIHLDYRFI